MHWTTPIMQWPTPAPIEWIEQLAATLLDLERSERSVTKSNRGGWQSRADLFERLGSPGQVYLDTMRELAYESIYRYLHQCVELPLAALYGGQVLPSSQLVVEIRHAWASVNRRSDLNSPPHFVN